MAECKASTSYLDVYFKNMVRATFRSGAAFGYKVLDTFGHSTLFVYRWLHLDIGLHLSTGFVAISDPRLRSYFGSVF